MKKLVFLAAAAMLLLAGCSLPFDFGFLGDRGGSDASALRSIAAYPETINLAEGGSETIRVVFTPSDAEEQDLLWASSNREVAVVNERGTVSAVGEGSCTITIASKTYSDISCHVEVIVGQGGGASQETQSPSNFDADPDYVTYVEETNAASVYPTYYLSESEVASMDGEQIQFIINQIYAKNGYVFRTTDIQNYFSRMPWYVPVSGDASRLQMSSVDRSNLNLLVRYRDGSSENTSGLGWMWTRHVVDGALTASYVRNLSDYDIQLLINTIYAKNGYIFETDSLQYMFEGQPWYHGVTRDGSALHFSSLDQKNLRLLTSYRS